MLLVHNGRNPERITSRVPSSAIALCYFVNRTWRAVSTDENSQEVFPWHQPYWERTFFFEHCTTIAPPNICYMRIPIVYLPRILATRELYIRTLNVYISPSTIPPSSFPQHQSTLPDGPPRLLLLPLRLPHLLFGHLPSFPFLFPHSPLIRFAFLSLLRWLHTQCPCNQATSRGWWFLRSLIWACRRARRAAWGIWIIGTCKCRPVCAFFARVGGSWRYGCRRWRARGCVCRWRGRWGGNGSGGGGWRGSLFPGIGNGFRVLLFGGRRNGKIIEGAFESLMVVSEPG